MMRACAPARDRLRLGRLLGPCTARDPHRLDPVLTPRLDADRVPVRGDLIASLRQPPELREDDPAARVVRVGVDWKLEPVVLEVRHCYVAADEPIPVREPADRAAGGVGL